MHRKTGAVAALAATAIVLAGCSAAEAEPAADGSAAPSGAEASTITVYTSEPQEKIDEIIAAFNEQRPEITVEVFRAGTGDLTARIESERAAGEVQADVLLAADAPTFEGYAAEGLLAELDTADEAALDPAVLDAEGYYVGTRIIPTVIAYNTDAVESAPTSWQELTDPSYADRLVMPNPDVSGAAAFNAAVWLDEEQLGEEWLTALAENQPVIVDSNGPASQAIASGAQPVGVVVDYLVRDLAAAGSPIAVSYPEEGVPFVSQPAGIFASSDEVAASQAFVDFLVSAEGQQLAVEQAYLPVRGDVGTPEGAPAMADIALLNPDLDVIAETKADAVATFNALFQ
ncbi:ABC transporter substrate-binding protein [Agrococcus baldri]|uniref:ABC transporter periplasmic component n=1 Tax=Agrococcus baldri TaxID=153730 RepID=A0AA87RCQ8_9MICO|nr:ABC transporter substrate-binding protein [Agrococcus baldri]GEK80287.1 ABC transporter periplasmic component [Agrococcus baldri]